MSTPGVDIVWLIFTKALIFGSTDLIRSAIEIAILDGLTLSSRSLCAVSE